MKKAFLDLDGTIIDSSKRHLLVLNEVLKELQIDLTVDKLFLEYKRDGYSTKQYLEKEQNLNKNISKQVADRWCEKIEEFAYLQHDCLYDDSIFFLEKLINKNYDIIYVTARKNREGLLDTLKQLGIRFYAEKIEIVSPFHAFEEKQSVIKKNYHGQGDIIVGDTEIEETIGQNLKIPSFVVNRGFRSKRYWDKNGIISYHSLDEIGEKI